MNVSRWGRQIAHLYLKDGLGWCIGKLAVSSLLLVGMVDLIFGTRYLELIIVFSVVLIPAIVIGFGSLILKILDHMGKVELGPQEEAVRKLFGLVTGMEDWYEMAVDYFTD